MHLAAGALAAQAGELEDVAVATKSGCHLFVAEIADTALERGKGLMFRTSLPPDHGMLFDFGVEAPVAFWMKNTEIPLDMFFIDAKGVVVAIKENSTPQSTEIIPSGAPALGVLEVNAGTARSIGAAVGDRVENRMFGGGGACLAPPS